MVAQPPYDQHSLMYAWVQQHLDKTIWIIWTWFEHMIITGYLASSYAGLTYHGMGSPATWLLTFLEHLFCQTRTFSAAWIACS